MKNTKYKNMFITLLLVYFVLASLVAIYFCTMYLRESKQNKVYGNSDTNSYNQNIYLAIDSMKNIETDLGKVAISSGKSNQSQLLNKVSIQANLVNQALSNLPVENSDNYADAQKFVNQTQDYATYLICKLSNGETLTDSERQALINLHSVAKEFTTNLANLVNDESVEVDTNGISELFGEIESQTFSYEKLIYDGPFSESTEEKVVENENALSTAEVTQVVEKFFGKSEYVGTINNKGTFLCFDSEKGRVLATPSGKIAEFDGKCEDGNKNLSVKDCLQVAEDFSERLGFSVKSIWYSKEQDNIVYVNLAPVENGVIIYSDIVKVAVCTQSGEVVGLESRAYLINHRERSIAFGSLSEDSAQQKLNKSLQVENVNKALVSKNNKEVACYEFECSANGSQYFIYIDSTTGEEVEIFKVIHNTEGFTVM